jgi:hypothetical protein
MLLCMCMLFKGYILDVVNCLYSNMLKSNESQIPEQEPPSYVRY